MFYVHLLLGEGVIKLDAVFINGEETGEETGEEGGGEEIAEDGEVGEGKLELGSGQTMSW